MIEVSKREDVTCIKGTLEILGHSSIVYVYLVDDLLIDTGPQSLESELIELYKQYSFDQIVITHSHEDHVGCAAWLQEFKQVPIWIHAKGIEACSNLEPYPRYRQIVWGQRREFTARPIMGRCIRSNKQELEVVETPGHADDHIVLWNEQTGQLFSGDLFLTTRPKIFLRFESISTIMNSIRRVLEYDFQSLFCAHAGYIPDGKRKLHDKLQSLEEISGEILHRYHKGHTIPEITKQLFPNTPPIVSFSDREFDTVHIVRSVITEMAAMS